MSAPAPAQPKLRVAICGGGVGGLALAVALSSLSSSSSSSHQSSPYPQSSSHQTRQHIELEVDVYESARAFAEVGAGVGLWPRAWRVVRALAPGGGLADELAAVAGMGNAAAPGMGMGMGGEREDVLAFNFRTGDAPQGTTFQRLATPGGLISLHRPDFQAVLLRHLGPRVRTHTGKRLVSYSQPASPSYSPSTDRPDGEIRLAFADGTHAACDVLVGADGVRSAVRACMLAGPAAASSRSGSRSNSSSGSHSSSGSGASHRGAGSSAGSHSHRGSSAGAADDERGKADAVWSGTVSYRATVSADALRRRWPGHRVLSGPYIYMGTDGELTVYPLAHGLINVAAFRARYACEGTPPRGPWVQDAPRAELLAAFGGWEDEVRALLECVETCSRWAVPMVVPLRTFVSGRVALLGDAAHAMMPYQGSGAGQAIEDAYLLATLLTHPRVLDAPHPRARAEGLARALAAYDAVRRPFAQAVAQRSRDAGVLYTLNHRELVPHPPAAAHPPSPLYPSTHSPHRSHHRHRGSAHAPESDLLARTPDKRAFAPGRDRAGDGARLQAVYARVVAAWTWAWETTADDDVARAVRMLESGEGL